MQNMLDTVRLIQLYCDNIGIITLKNIYKPLHLNIPSRK